MPDDPKFWQVISNWLWGILAVPVAFLWKRVDNAVQRDELVRAQNEMRDDIRQLFRNAELDRASIREDIDRLQNVIHTVHVDLLEKMRNGGR